MSLFATVRGVGVFRNPGNSPGNSIDSLPIGRVVTSHETRSINVFFNGGGLAGTKTWRRIGTGRWIPGNEISRTTGNNVRNLSGSVTNIQPRRSRAVHWSGPANVRRGPGSTFALVRTLSPGTTVTPTHRVTTPTQVHWGTPGRWVRIAYRQWVIESLLTA